MVSRHPHTATVTMVTETKGPGGLNGSVTRSFDVKGRFQPGATRTKGIDYKAKFYCKNISHAVTPFLQEGLFPLELMAHEGKSELKPYALDGHRFTLEGKHFEIVMLHNYQTHCEIWLE